MGQPLPPGDNVPLYEGLDASWNEFVSAIPEDKRAEFAPKLKERIDQYEPLKQWEDLQKSGITPQHASTALDIFTVLENNPKEVYETIGKHLGISPQEAKEAVKELEKAPEGGPEDPRLKTLQQQVDTLTQIALAQRQMSSEEQQAAEADAAVANELDGLKKKYGDTYDEEQIIMRMVHKNLTAEQAYQEYASMVSTIQQRRPAPMLLGSGGVAPNRAIDVKKLDSAGTKNLVKQMLDHANAERG